MPPRPRRILLRRPCLALAAREGNLTRVNATSRIRCYLAVAPSLPDGYALTPKEASKKLQAHYVNRPRHICAIQNTAVDTKVMWRVVGLQAAQPRHRA